MRRLLIAVLISCSPAFALAARPPHVRPHSPKQHVRAPRTRYIRHPFWHPMFLPTHESLIRQNAEIARLGLPRIYDDDDLNRLINSGDLVPLPLGKHLTVDPRLPLNRRYCRPWTAQFLTDLSDQFYAVFEIPLQVNSAVRTVEVQQKLRRWNRNAAPIDGEAASSHLAGLTVDLERKRLTKAQVRFVEMRLLYLRAMDMVEVEEEYYQLCFHVMVSGRYGKPDVQTTTVDLPITTIEDAPDADRITGNEQDVPPDQPR